MAIVRTPMIDDDGSGTTGTIINNAWKQELYNQIDGVLGPLGGAWTNVPFSAANFVYSGGAWTVASGDLYANHYTLIGQTLIWSMMLFTSTVTGAGLTLAITVPAGKTISIHNPHRVARCMNNAVPLEVEVTHGSTTQIYLQRIDGGNFAGGSLRIDFTVTLFVA